jgi:hypothetical protein
MRKTPVILRKHQIVPAARKRRKSGKETALCTRHSPPVKINRERRVRASHYIHACGIDGRVALRPADYHSPAARNGSGNMERFSEYSRQMVSDIICVLAQPVEAVYRAAAHAYILPRIFNLARDFKFAPEFPPEFICRMTDI